MKDITEHLNESLKKKVDDATETSKLKFFGLEMPKNLKDVQAGIDEILSEYGSRDMANLQVNAYLVEINKDGLGMDWLKKKKIDSKVKLTTYLKGRQTKVRKSKVAERKKALKALDKLKADSHLSNILSLAKSESERWDKMVDDYDKKNK